MSQAVLHPDRPVTTPEASSATATGLLNVVGTGNQLSDQSDATYVELWSTWSHRDMLDVHLNPLLLAGDLVSASITLRCSVGWQTDSGPDYPAGRQLRFAADLSVGEAGDIYAGSFGDLTESYSVGATPDGVIRTLEVPLAPPELSSRSLAETMAALNGGAHVQIYTGDQFIDSLGIQIPSHWVRVYDVAVNVVVASTWHGKLYWSSNHDLVQGWDSATNTVFTLTSNDPRVPTAAFDRQLGAFVVLGSGDLLLAYRSFSGDDQMAFTVSQELDPTGGTWLHNANDAYNGRAYVNYDEESGVYDPVTGRNWLARSVEGTPWGYYGYDNTGTFAEGRFDTSTIVGPDKDHYVGGSTGEPLNISLAGRWLYRNPRSNDAIMRYNLDTNVMEAVLAVGFDSNFVGFDTVNGQVVTICSERGPQLGWAEVRNPDTIPWVQALGSYDTLNPMGPPDARFNTAGAGGPARPLTDPRMGTNGVVVVDGKLIYANFPQQPGDYSYDPVFSPLGYAVSFYAMDLSDGSIEKIVDIPYHYYDLNGVALDDPTGVYPGYFVDNLARGVFGLVAIPEAVVEPVLLTPALTGELLDTGQRFQVGRTTL